MKENFNTCSDGFPFIEEDFDSLTEYEMICKLDEKVDDVISEVNTEFNTVDNKIKNKADVSYVNNEDTRILKEANKYTDDNIKNNDSNIASREKWATLKDSDSSDINSVDTFRTHFYELRKSENRKYQFEVSPGVNENIVIGVEGLPQGEDIKDKGFIYVELPYSEAGGFIIDITYENRSKNKIYNKKDFGTLDSNWKSTGWYEIGKSNSSDVFNVEIEKDGFGNYTADYNDNDINNARNSGKVVQAKYYDDTVKKTYTYYYSTMESDRKPTFIRTYNKDNSTIQVLISVDNAKKVTVEERKTVIPSKTSELTNDSDFVSGKVVTTTTGSYIKFSDGTLIEWGIFNTNSKDFTHKYGNNYTDNKIHTITYPISFIDTPTPITNVILPGGIGGASVSENNNSNCKIYIFNSLQYTFKTNILINWISIGKWK